MEMCPVQDFWLESEGVQDSASLSAVSSLCSVMLESMKDKPD